MAIAKALFPQTQIAVPETGTLDSLLVWILRNRILAGWSIALPPIGCSETVDRALRSIPDPGRTGFVRTLDFSGFDFAAYSGSEPISGWPDRQGLVLPGFRHDPPKNPGCILTEVVIGAGPSEVLLIPGSGTRTDSRLDAPYIVDPESIERLRKAHDWISKESTPGPEASLMILSGWSTSPESDELTEAEQMLKNWPPDSSRFILDPAARTTAENALFAVEVSKCFSYRPPVTAYVSWTNALRLKILLKMAARGTGVKTRVTCVFGRGHGKYWRPGLSGLLFMKRHLDSGRRRMASVSKP